MNLLESKYVEPIKYDIYKVSTMKSCIRWVVYTKFIPADMEPVHQEMQVASKTNLLNINCQKREEKNTEVAPDFLEELGWLPLCWRWTRMPCSLAADLMVLIRGW